jgi:hypothetical protein
MIQLRLVSQEYARRGHHNSGYIPVRRSTSRGRVFWKRSTSRSAAWGGRSHASYSWTPKTVRASSRDTAFLR